MSDIFLDPTVLVLAGSEPVNGDRAALAPGAWAALRNLADTGHRIMIVGDAAATALVADEIGVPVQSVPAIAEDASGWLIVGDPRGCETRRPGIRTMLLGPRRAVSSAPVRHCDVEARDLAEAVLEILAREAMPRRGTSGTA